MTFRPSGTLLAGLLLLAGAHFARNRAFSPDQNRSRIEKVSARTLAKEWSKGIRRPAPRVVRVFRLVRGFLRATSFGNETANQAKYANKRRISGSAGLRTVPPLRCGLWVRPRKPHSPAPFLCHSRSAHVWEFGSFSIER
jgi:hypothetical protein